jgi:hypothetical protein
MDQEGGIKMLTDHYFEAVFTDPQGRPITPERFRTLQSALLCADEQDCAVTGTIFYVEDPALPAQAVILYLNGEAKEAQ